MILSAAMNCFVLLGLKGTRVQDVLEEAKVSRGTFYRHFSNLDSIIVELAAMATSDMLVAEIAASSSECLGSAARVTRVIASISARRFDPQIVRLIDESAEMPRFSNLMMNAPEAMLMLAEPLYPLLEAGLRDGSFRRELTIEQMVEWLIRNANSIRRRLPPWARTVTELEQYVAEFVMPALVTRRPDNTVDIIARLDRIERKLDCTQSPDEGR